MIDPIGNSALLSRVIVGSRLEVYWPSLGGAARRTCEVTSRQDSNDDGPCICNLRYDDDGVEETVDLTWEEFRILDDNDNDDNEDDEEEVDEQSRRQSAALKDEATSSSDEAYNAFLRVLGSETGGVSKNLESSAEDVVGDGG